MKKLLLGALAIVTAFSLVACGEKQEEKKVEEQPVSQVTENEVTSGDAVAPSTEINETESEAEPQIGVGNTDEGMVVLALEQELRKAFGEDVIEEVVPTSIKIYTPEEISGDELFKNYTIGEGDIVFSADYELKIKEGYEDMNRFTAGTGEVDGQWIRNKSNVGIVRTANGELKIDAFGTGF